MKRTSASAFFTSPAVGLSLLILIGVVLRLRGITWGLPHLYDPDEHFFVDPAVHFVVTGDPNPHWFGHPGSTVIHLLGLVFYGYWVIGHFAGRFSDLQSFGMLFATDPTSFYLIGRAFAIVLATLAIPLSYALARRMTGKGAALAAAAIVAISPLHAEFSRIVRTDPLMTTCLLAAMLFAVKAMESLAGRDFFLTGLFVGLAAATKYPGIIGAMVVVIAAVLARRGPPVSWTLRGRWVALACLGGVIGFVGGAPFAFTAVREIYWVLVVEGRHSHLGATGSPGLSNYLWYLRGPLREAVGLPVELVAGLGLAAAVWGRHRPRLLLVGFSVLFLLGIGLSLKRFDRWIVPLTPFVAILAAIGLETAVQAVRVLRNRLVLRELVVVALGVILALPPAVEAFAQGRTLDTRDIAKAWIDSHVPRGSTVLVEQYAPPISRRDYAVFTAVGGGLRRDAGTRGFKGVLGDLKSLGELREMGIEYVLLSDIYLNRYRRERTSYPDEIRLYEELLSAGDAIYELKPSESAKGPRILVLKLRR
jgi:4-amino-4-deoxy-L-arabinose transferase-like glycosyltransferase